MAFPRTHPLWRVATLLLALFLALPALHPGVQFCQDGRVCASCEAPTPPVELADCCAGLGGSALDAACADPAPRDCESCCLTVSDPTSSGARVSVVPTVEPGSACTLPPIVEPCPPRLTATVPAFSFVSPRARSAPAPTDPRGPPSIV